MSTPQKLNVATQNDGFEHVSPFKSWLFWLSIPRTPVIFLDDDLMSNHRNETQGVFRFHAPILSFGEPGSF